ncbi:MAG: hypothetical protein P4L50_11920 [Anaerolineaceae bacterium]|nr:hypothetical protein [Anaerolineaceae bacterium]
MDRLFQKIEVGVHKDIDGPWQPERFIWQSSTYSVLGIGRRWQEDDGEHMLVMVVGGQVYELIRAADQTGWYIKPSAGPRMA